MIPEDDFGRVVKDEPPLPFRDDTGTAGERVRVDALADRSVEDDAAVPAALAAAIVVSPSVSPSVPGRCVTSCVPLLLLLPLLLLSSSSSSPSSLS